MTALCASEFSGKCMDQTCGWFHFSLTTSDKATEMKGLRMAQWSVSPALCQNKPSTQVDKEKASEELCHELPWRDNAD